MKTQVIPAQITTVEDKIAGNLNLTQVLILMVPVIFTTVVYAAFPPKMHLLWYKFPFVIAVLIICLVLSLRVKGKVVLNWLMIILRYNLRPRYYIFNKNDSYLRTMDLPVFEKHPKRLFKLAPAKPEEKVLPKLSVTDLVTFEGLLQNPKYSFSLKSGRKGGLYVAFEQNQK